MMTREQIKGIAMLLALALFFWLLIFFTHRPASAVSSASTVKTTEAFWEKRISAVGGVDAYKEFGQSVANDTIDERHQLAHVFGGALYATEGQDSLTVCDTQFSYGCFHEFLGQAIAQKGLGVVNSLNDSCREKLQGTALSCQHGIGHGIAAFIGYKPSDLDKELEICKGLPYNDPIGGCYAGVFMEYNMRTMLGSDATLREPENGDLLAPCDRLAREYLNACAYWQPQWWEQRLFGAATKADTFKQVGSNCIMLSEDASVRRSCFEGIGTLTPSAVNYDPMQSAALCESASDKKLYQLFCKANAANALFVETHSAENATKVCAGLLGTSAPYCSAYASNRANIVNQEPLPVI